MNWEEPGPLPRETDPAMIQLRELIDRRLSGYRARKAREENILGVDLDWEQWQGGGPDAALWLAKDAGK